MTTSNTKRRRIAAERFMTDMSQVMIRHRNRGLSLLEMCGYTIAMITNVVAKKYGAQAARGILLSMAEKSDEIEKITEDEELASFLAQAKPAGRA